MAGRGSDIRVAPTISRECPCQDCDIRASEDCDHGIRCPRGFAAWKLELELKHMQINKVNNVRKEEINYEMIRTERIRRRKA